MAVFWHDLNNFQVNMFTAQMGAASAYTTMKVATVNRRIFADMFEWPYWTLPAIAVSCYQVDYSANEHMGGGSKLYRRVYRCAAFGLISGTINYEVSPVVDTITDALAEFYERMEAVLRTTQITVQSAGIIARDATIVGGHIDQLPYTDDDTGSTRRIGVAHFRYDIVAKG